MLKIYFLIINVLVLCSSQDVNITCTEDFCKEQRDNGQCVDQVTEECREKGVMLKSPTPCNCCEYCVSYLDEKERCDNGVPSSTPLNKICGPGLTCVSNYCEKMSSENTESRECIIKQTYYDDHAEGSMGEISWRPVCDSEGYFGPVHCIPNSICYCIDPYDGTRIFGEAIYKSDDARGQGCPCSIAAWKAKTYLGLNSDFFRCLPEGNYDQLQCIDDECMCVDEATGTPIGTTRVHVTSLKKGALPCFDEDLHPVGQFEKSCELERKNIIRDISFWQIKGIELLFVDLPACAEDGSYHRVQLRKKGKGFRCVDPDGKLIKQYEKNNGKSDCKCARTEWLTEKAGIPELPQCNADGMYKAWQCWRDKCYCVDCDGNQTTDHTSYSNIHTLQCYENTSCENSSDDKYE